MAATRRSARWSALMLLLHALRRTPWLRFLHLAEEDSSVLSLAFSHSRRDLFSEVGESKGAIQHRVMAVRVASVSSAHLPLQLGQQSVYSAGATLCGMAATCRMAAPSDPGCGPWTACTAQECTIYSDAVSECCYPRPNWITVCEALICCVTAALAVKLVHKGKTLRCYTGMKGLGRLLDEPLLTLWQRFVQALVSEADPSKDTMPGRTAALVKRATPGTSGSTCSTPARIKPARSDVLTRYFCVPAEQAHLMPSTALNERR